jgi:ADP-dependent glucokinase
MASFAEPACLKDIVETVVRYSDSVGMNEQELPNLLSLLTVGSITAVADAYPRVATTLDQMRELYRLLRQMTDGMDSTGQQRRMSRLHVHTLAFQAILIDDSLEGRSSWKNTGPAAAHSSLAASRHTCGDWRVAVNRSRLLLDDSFSVSTERESRRVQLQPEEPVSCWNEMSSDYGATQICLAPVLVCTNVVQTVGGGDNISTAGIVVQL